jgi:protein SCO1/2
VILSLLLAASPLGAQVDWPKPDALEGVGVVENLGERLPLEVVFTDHDGKRVRLGDLVRGDLPLVVTPVYYGCPTLCPLTLQGVVGALKATGLRLDEDYRLITYSIDPADTVEDARARRLDLIHALGFPSGRPGWEFLVGDEASSRELSRALGFDYRYVDAAKQWAHSATFMVLTPDGRISRYFYGVQYPPRDVRLSLVEASGGRVGTTFDRVLLTCFRFDPNARGYQFWVKGAVRAVGLVTFCALAALMAVLWRRDARRASS